MAKLTSDQGEGSEFFRVFIPSSSSSRQMLIPPDFVREFIIPEIVSEKAVLKDEIGKAWHVGLEKIENRLYFTKGWERFVADQSLERGDFLLFKYIGNYVFKFKIFSINGCKKKVASRVPDLGDHEKIIEEKSGLSPKRSDQNKIMRDASSSIIPNLEAKKVSKPDDNVATKTINFVKTITKTWSGLHVVYLPRPMSKKLKLEPDMTLCYQKKLWPVKVTFKKDGRSVITAGWVNFFKDNNLKVNDKCIFEPVFEKGKICKQMKVQVINGERA